MQIAIWPALVLEFRRVCHQPWDYLHNSLSYRIVATFHSQVSLGPECQWQGFQLEKHYCNQLLLDQLNECLSHFAFLDLDVELNLDYSCLQVSRSIDAPAADSYLLTLKSPWLPFYSLLYFPSTPQQDLITAQPHSPSILSNWRQYSSQPSASAPAATVPLVSSAAFASLYSQHFLLHLVSPSSHSVTFIASSYQDLLTLLNLK